MSSLAQVTVSAANLCDATGTTITNATISFQPVLSNGTPTSFRYGGSTGGQVSMEPVTKQVVNGAFSIVLADTTQTVPVNVGYAVTVTDNESGEELLGPGYGLYQPPTHPVTFDSFAPNLAAQVTVQAGPQGIQGVPGISSLVQLAAVRFANEGIRNLLDPNLVTVDTYINSSTGAVVSLSAGSGFSASGFIPAYSGGTMATATVLRCGTPAGYAFYDQSYTFISGYSGTNVAAGGTFSVPATAAFVRVTLQTADLSTAAVVNGSTAVPAYPFGTPNLLPELAAIRFANEGIRDLLDMSAVTTSSYINSGTGALVTNSSALGFSASGFIPANSGGSMTTATVLRCGTPAGYAFYDGNKVFISGYSGSNIAAGATITIPVAAAFIRVTFQTADTPSAVIVNGTTLPASYGFGSLSAAQIATIAQKVALSYQAVTFNLFNPAATTLGLISATNGSIVVSVSYAASAFIPVMPGATYNFAQADPDTNGTLGSAFYDINGNYVSAGPTYPWAAGVTFTVPPSATQFRFSCPLSALYTQMLTLGSTPPASYIPFGITPAQVLPLSAVNVAAWGDSITDFGQTSPATDGWQRQFLALTNARLAFQDSRAGRNWSQIFECYGGTATGTNRAVTVGSNAAHNTGTVGNTLAQDLAAANVTTGLIFLGTNDGPTTLGAHGDSTMAGTLYGNILAGIQGILNAVPSMRLMLVTPYYDTSYLTPAQVLSIGLAVQTVSADYGLPVLDLARHSGINSYNFSTSLRDGLHPTPATFNAIIAPAFARFMSAWK